MAVDAKRDSWNMEHPAPSPVAPRNHHKDADDWYCYERIEEDFRIIGKNGPQFSS